MVVFRSLAHHGQVAIAAAGRPTASPTLSALHCDRVYFAAGRGLCLARGGFPVGYRAEVFGPDLRVRHALGVTGIPEPRARVPRRPLRGGRRSSSPAMPTRSRARSRRRRRSSTSPPGRRSPTSSSFTVLRGSRQVTAIDVNFWGVTFARDSDRFYATLATGGKTYLIRGSVRAARRA